MNQEKQRKYIESITEQMINYAQLNFDNRIDIYADPAIDEVVPGLAAGVNLLGEELQHKVKELNRLNQEIEGKKNLLNSITLAVPEVILVYNQLENQISYLNKCTSINRSYPCPVAVMELPGPCENCTVKDLIMSVEIERFALELDQDEIKVLCPGKTAKWFKTTANVFEKDAAGFCISSLITLADISILKTKEMELINNERVISNSLKEKALLLQEVHHRVKNNLQIIYGLLSMQANRADSEEVKEQLIEIKNRIFSISLIHEELYQSDNFAMIDVDRYCRKLCESLASVYAGAIQVELILQVDSGIQVGIDQATPLGLLINEVLCNSYKHAFKGAENGKIWLTVTANANSYLLQIKDSGQNHVIEQVNNKAGNSLGNKLIKGLSQQLRAKLEITHDNGYTVQLTIPRMRK